MQSARRASTLLVPTGKWPRNASTLPWYRKEISSIVPQEPAASSVSIEDLKRLVTVPKGRDILNAEIQAQGRSAKAGTYVSLAQKKQQDRVWTRLQRVLSDVEKEDGKNLVALSDAYTAAFQALQRAKMPYDSMETLLKYMQNQGIPVSAGVHIAMLCQARGPAIVQVLRKLKASRATSALLDGTKKELLPTDIQALHYRAYEAFIRTIHERYMESNTATFSLESYQDLFWAIVDALPQYDIKLMERTINEEHLDKLAVASVRAPAMCGLADIVLDRLETLSEEYAGRSSPLPPLVFEAAIETFSHLVHGLTHVPKSTLVQLRKSSQVQSNPRVKALRQVERAISTPLTEHMRLQDSSDDPGLQKTLRKASAYLDYVAKRIDGVSSSETIRFATHEAMKAADGLVADVFDQHATSGGAARPLNLQVALLRQYFVTASRFDRRIDHNSALQDELVFRIFRTLDQIAADMTDAEETQVLEALRYAFRALVVMFRVSEATMVLDMKETLFPHIPRSAEEYDDLIMALCANRKTRIHQPMQILQRMHNLGMQPTPLTMHRLTTFRVYQLEKKRASHGSRKLIANKMFVEMQRTLDGWNIDVPEPEAHPLQFYVSEDNDESIDEILSFLIDWHNMTGVVPFGKTLKLVADHCVSHSTPTSNHIHELRRLVQWASSLPLEASTQVYLDHALSQANNAQKDNPSV